MGGSRRFGPYRIIKKLGEGGFGRTYLVEHTLLGCPAVIKQSFFRDDDARETLKAEARLLYRIHHWALPTVKDVLLTEGGDYLVVMSFIEGDELMQYVPRHGALDAETTCWIAQRVLAALHYLHYLGIVHRDVKPANIIVDWRTHGAVLVDFGLAEKWPSGHSETRGYTPCFGAPEQISGMPAVPESDIFGLGMTMIYLLGGDLPTKQLPQAVPTQLKSFVQSGDPQCWRSSINW